MGSSGLLYAAIVAAWAAVLVPRWIRRNEEIERAREEDTSRGVRVLDRQQRPVRAHSGLTADRDVRRPATTERAEPVRDRPRAGNRPVGGGAAARRRRFLALLLVAVGGAVVGAAAGELPAGFVVVPVLVLLAFLFLARRAAVLEARRRRAVARRNAAQRRAALAAQQETGSSKRVGVLDEPAPQTPRDPDAWDPVPVPPPTYLIKPKAEPRVVRKIDLSAPGAWTSGRLNPDSAVAPPSQPAGGDDAPERRRAVGD